MLLPILPAVDLFHCIIQSVDDCIHSFGCIILNALDVDPQRAFLCIDHFVDLPKFISTDKIMAASAPIMTIADNMINEFAGLYLNLPSHSYVRTNDDTTITTDVPGVDKKDVEIGI